MHNHKMIPIMLIGTLVAGMTVSGCAKSSRTTEMQAPQRTSMVRGTEETPNTTNMANMPMSDMMTQCQDRMVTNLDSTPKGTQYDKEFIDTMISHHEGAVRMAQDAQQGVQHPELKKFAQQVEKQQQKEISELKSWRDKWFSANMPTTGMGMTKEGVNTAKEGMNKEVQKVTKTTTKTEPATQQEAPSGQ